MNKFFLSEMRIPHISQQGFIKLTKRTLVTYLIVSTVALSSGLIYLFNPFNKSAEAAWFNDNWGYRQEVPVTSTNGSAQSNVFISFSLDTATLITAGKLQSACQGIRITDVSGNLLPYHIGRTNACNASNTTIDFLLSSFPDLKSTYYVYYGNPSAVSADAGAFSGSQASNYSVGSLGTEVTAAAPKLYYKFDDAQGTTANDSTTQANNGTLGGATVPTWQTEDQCISGKCLYFNGATSKVTGSKVIKGVKSVSMWVKPNTLSSTNALIDLDGGTHKITYNSSGVITATGFSTPTIYVNTVVSGAITVNKWNFVEVTTGTGFDSTSTFTIGTDGTNLTKGFFDEVRIYDYARSAAQINADYAARSNPEGVSGNLGANTQNLPGALNNGLVGYWKMDESAANSCTGGTNDNCDSSGNGNDGAWIGDATTSSGRFGNSTTFDGTGDYIDVGSPSSLDNIRTNGMTYAAWINPNFSSCTVSTFFHIIMMHQNGASLYVYCDGASNLKLWFTDGTSGTSPDYRATVTLSNSAWYHVAAVYQRDKTVKLYLNGQEVSTYSTSTQGTGTEIDDSSNNFFIGEQVGGSQYFNGKLDEVRAYNRSLSSAEVSQLYNFAPGPFIYYKLDDGTGTAITDSSGSGNNGSITVGSNNTAWVPGKYGKGLNISAGGGGRIDTGTTGGLSNSSFTAGAWLKRASTGVSSTLVGNGGTTDNTLLRLGYDTSDHLFLDFFNNTLTSTSTFTDTDWHYIVATYDAVSNDRRIYRDGAVIAEDTASADFQGTTNLFVGYEGSGSSEANGIIDEARFYNYVRTQQQVVQDMNGGHPPPGSPVGSPLGYWKFDEGYGTIANNSGNGGTAYAGTLNGDAAYTNAGKFGKALTLDGIGDYVKLGTTLNTDLNQITVSGWYKYPAIENNTRIICKEDGSDFGESSTAFCITQRLDDNKLEFMITTDVLSANTVVSDNAISTDTWHYFAGVWDGTTESLYIDGVKQQDTKTVTGTMANPSTATYIGAYLVSGVENRFFGGQLDDIKVYSSALTDQQVILDMNRGQAQQLGALSDKSGNQAQSADNEYCIPGDTSTCTSPVARYNMEDANPGGITNTGSDSSISFIQNFGNGVPSTGRFGKGFSLSGANEFRQNDTSLSVQNQTVVTAEIWVKPDSLPASSDFMGLYSESINNNNSAPRFFIALDNGAENCSGTVFGFHFRSPDSSPTYDICGTTTVTTGKWYHVVVVFDSVTDKHYLYVNGRAEGSLSQAVPAFDNTTGGNQPNIGTFTNLGNGFIGKVDEFRMYRYARTPAQVAWDYNRGGPVAWWKMDECQGSTIHDSSVNGAGTGSNGLNGTWSGSSGAQTTAGTCTTSSTAWGNGVTGKRNASLNFDGTDDRVTVSNNAQLGITGDITIAAWVKRSSTGTSDAILTKSNLTNSWDYDFYIRNGNNLSFYSDSTTPSERTSNTNIDTNWHHVVVVRSGSNVYFYIDGRLDQPAQSQSGAFSNNSYNVTIGTENPGATDFGGQIDDLRLYNYALTEKQVQLMMNEGGQRFGPVTGTP